MEEAKNAETLARYGQGTPDDWIERNIFSRFTWQGVGLMVGADLILFGFAGLAIWGVQMLWIPFHAAGIINGIGHWWGYRNYDSPDASNNIVPWGIWIGGEELHNNHHTYPTSAKFSAKWHEFDIGWVYIRAIAGGWAGQGVACRAQAAGGRTQAIDRPGNAAGGDLEPLRPTGQVRAIAEGCAPRRIAEARVCHATSMRALLGSRGVLRKGDVTQLATAEQHSLSDMMKQSGVMKTLVEMRTELLGHLGAFFRIARADADPLAGLDSSRRSERHSCAAGSGAANAQLPSRDRLTFSGKKKPGTPGLFMFCFASLATYFSLISLYATCLRATGSNLLNCSLSGVVFLFLVVV